MNRRFSVPAELYALVEQRSATVLLEAGFSGDKFCSRLFIAPVRVIEANSLAEISELFAQIESAVAAGFVAAGFFSYECGKCFEPSAHQRPSRSGQPLAWFGIYERSYLFDHRIGNFVGSDAPSLIELRDEYCAAAHSQTTVIKSCLDMSEWQYTERIAAIHEQIRAGDVYQLNFTLPLQLETETSAAALYAQLRARQPVDYGAFLHWRPGQRVLSFSPEMFFHLEDEDRNRRIVTRPMKGTAPRGRTVEEDRAMASWLRNDAKNRAENVMIVDLLRNDLGRICRFGSVRAEELFAVERHPALWQMTSTVSGEVRSDVGFRDIFGALFPCGSITGAPKVRAMQLIAELEGEPRGIYTGAIGFFSKERSVFNVAIRTLELEGSNGGRIGKMGVGSGIVIDSNAADEFRECQLKAAFLVGASASLHESFSLVETLLWRSEYPLIELHLDRLTGSADYFDLRADRIEVKAALLAHASAFGSCEPRKVRLLLNRDGGLEIANEPLSEIAQNARLDSVCIAEQRTDSRDPMLFHKTTHRPIYTAANKAAMEAGFNDVLFLNQRNEVTEGAISNIFIEKNRCWYTPPIECGLLAGVQRRQLLESRSQCEERVLSLDDLRDADAVYLSNAVRGLRRVVIDWEFQLSL
jgi:para-aminobenzoate synthetase/4-amino-4-deoxychorismate lyase